MRGSEFLGLMIVIRCIVVSRSFDIRNERVCVCAREIEDTYRERRDYVYEREREHSVCVRGRQKIHIEEGIIYV